MADKPRRRPFVWPKVLTRLLSGEAHCWWAAWYKSHFAYERVADDHDREEFFTEYNRKHDEIAARAAARYRAEGWLTRLEHDAEFRIVGDVCDLSGRPDLVALHEDGKRAVILDAKAGRKREADHWQVLIYMLALPLSWLKGCQLEGVVEYPDGPEDVRPLRAQERDLILAAIRKAGGPDAPERVPSRGECRYCDIAACPDRYLAPDENSGGLF